jgi:hypothetical protein
MTWAISKGIRKFPKTGWVENHAATFKCHHLPVFEDMEA